MQTGERGSPERSASQTLASNLKKLMDAASTSRSALAREAQIDEKTVYNILAGNHSPTLELIERVASAFGLSGFRLGNC